MILGTGTTGTLTRSSVPVVYICHFVTRRGRASLDARPLFWCIVPGVLMGRCAGLAFGILSLCGVLVKESFCTNPQARIPNLYHQIAYASSSNLTIQRQRQCVRIRAKQRIVPILQSILDNPTTKGYVLRKPSAAPMRTVWMSGYQGRAFCQKGGPYAGNDTNRLHPRASLQNRNHHSRK